MIFSNISAEVMEAAEKIKKLNEENEKRKLWLAENMRKQEFRLKEESKVFCFWQNKYVDLGASG
jgi:hypothetical protein